MPADKADIVRLCMPEEETVTVRLALLEQQRVARAAKADKVCPDVRAMCKRSSFARVLGMWRSLGDLHWRVIDNGMP